MKFEKTGVFSVPNDAPGRPLKRAHFTHKPYLWLKLKLRSYLSTDTPDALQPVKERKNEGLILPFKPRRCPRPQKEWI